MVEDGLFGKREEMRTGYILTYCITWNQSALTHTYVLR
jgi:hypothetical protein